MYSTVHRAVCSLSFYVHRQTRKCLPRNRLFTPAERNVPRRSTNRFLFLRFCTTITTYAVTAFRLPSAREMVAASRCSTSSSSSKRLLHAEHERTRAHGGCAYFSVQRNTNATQQHRAHGCGSHDRAHTHTHVHMDIFGHFRTYMGRTVETENAFSRALMCKAYYNDPGFMYRSNLAACHAFNCWGGEG